METLIEKSILQTEQVPMDFKRYLYQEIDWDYRLLAIQGARGAGKTTLMLQYMREKDFAPEVALYAALDDLYFVSHTLSDFATEFVKRGGQYLFLDEVHKYTQWSREIKHLHDTYKDLHIIFTSSSLLEIQRGDADLSRRAAVYQLQELSFREYLQLMHQQSFQTLSLADVRNKHGQYARAIASKIKPIALFEAYLQFGAYPFIAEGKTLFYKRVDTAINQALDMDLPAVEEVTYGTLRKIKVLLTVIAESAPFKPNIAKLSEKTGTSRDKVLKYLHYLEKAQVVKLLRKDTRGISYMSKPEKVYLHNAVIMHALNWERVNAGALRETFFANQLDVKHSLRYTDKGDFLVDDRYVFEIGGKNKTRKQIQDIPEAYVAADNIEYGHGNTIPLWLFGFLY